MAATSAVAAPTASDGELMLGAKRFSDLKDDLPGISSNVLSHRLDELEQSGIVRRHKLPPPAASWVCG